MRGRELKLSGCSIRCPQRSDALCARARIETLAPPYMCNLGISMPSVRGRELKLEKAGENCWQYRDALCARARIET